MKTPIIVNGHGDIAVYDTVEDAEMDLEAIDVANGEYVGYDSEGRLLSLLPNWPHSAFLKEGETEPTHKNELRAKLLIFLSQLGLSDDWLMRASLDQLVEKARATEYRAANGEDR